MPLKKNKLNMKLLVTGAAGFIGAAIVKALLKEGHEVIGLDNINSYYDTSLKYARLNNAGIQQADIRENEIIGGTQPNYRFIKMDLTDRIHMDTLFKEECFDCVINLAGQAGVRYSIENPFAYIESNIFGFLNILENCRHYPVKHLIYASSSSVYGMNKHFPYTETDKTDTPVSLYAATKKSDEMLAFTYSHLYGIPATGVRFFTVYGPWGRPDMAPFIFLRSILAGKEIRVFNHGDMKRDFTYIDDITHGLMLLLKHSPTSQIPHTIYNIGHSNPVPLMEFIYTIEQVSGKQAIIKMEDMQAGDVYCTYADTTRFEQDLGYRPSISEGIKHFYDWYQSFYKE